MKIYISSRLENTEQVKYVQYVLNQAGHEITYDWTGHGRIHDQSQREKFARNEVDGVLKANLLVVLLPGGRGTHTEMGVAIGADIDIVAIGTRVDTDPIFYWHPLVTWFQSIEAFQEICASIG